MVTDSLIRVLKDVLRDTDTSGESQKRIKFDGGAQNSEVTVSRNTKISTNSVADVYGGTGASDELQQAQAHHLNGLFSNSEATIAEAPRL
ncbi:hypothetical protein, partial [Haladaptatus sp.]|uniref:hypothetical protein n=1 Tax=Haladaptatus sp. TaxID=1973141 RepID=UPI003C4B77BD